MLDVAYEAVTDLAPGSLARIDEDRGTIRVRLDRAAPLADVVRQLNVEVDQLMSSARWFQLWEDEIVCSNTPGRPLRIEYLFCPKVPRDMGVGVAEDRGTVRVYICPAITTLQFAVFMTEATKDFLAGGHWFQLYGGEIIDNGPEPKSKV